ncbi:hypothetical protein ACX9MO_12555 [Pseudooceanicola sp. 502str34]|uniref:hypothetical protein n=1 Tax=Maritimibacter alkaliphilus TaxID=404236 RepID=UPI001C96DA34|nr:hypothetical protein [Maritimibacter alkaliphilus]MBY6088759.1 hypothetical protein [Maritimibacter alkaliphilus]
MRLFIVLALAGTALAGCERCNPRPNANLNIGLGTGGVRTGLNIGQSCGPLYVGVRAGEYYHPYW